MLEVVGLTEEHERLYRLVLGHPASSLEELVRGARLSARDVRKHMDELERAGLVSRVPSRELRWMPAPPDVAIEALLRRQEDAISSARAEARSLSAALRGETESAVQPVDIVAGTEAMTFQFEQLQRVATKLVRIFDRPPYVSKRPRINSVELERMEAGVRYRVLYEQRSLQEKWPLIEASVRAGEEARVVQSLPLKLAIADTRRAMVYEETEAGLRSAIGVHPSPLLDALVALFDIFWERGVPLPRVSEADSPDEALDDLDERVLTLLAAGFKDTAISRELGISLRTAQRRVAELMDRLGATSRFQAGMQAVRMNLLDT